MGTGERRLWWALWPVLAAFTVVGAVIQAGHGPQNEVIQLLAGCAFLISGLVAWRRRPDNNLGRLMVLAGVAWTVGHYADARVDVVPSLGIAFTGFEPIVIAHLALAYPEGRLRRRDERLVIGAGYALVGAATVAHLLTFNPRRDFGCDCPSAPLGLLTNPGLVRFTQDARDVVAGAVVLWAVVFVVRRLVRANPAERWLLSPLWIVAAVAGVTFTTQTTLGFVSVSDATVGRVDDVLNAMSTLVPVALLGGIVRMRLERSALGDLVVALGGGTSGETLQRALANALHDPSVELAYWLADRGVFVDAGGRHYLPPADGAVRTTTLIERDGERLAILVHDRALLENPQLIETTTAAAGLALENERLQAALRAQIAEVEASRTRIIEASDDARRRIERDLHDGAQQQLLTTAMSLRLANDALGPDADPAARTALEAAAAETLVAVGALRELAQGIHPAVLLEEGLRAAVEVLAERAPVAVTIDIPETRYPPDVEAAAYFVVSEALSNVAKHASATRVSVRAHRDRGFLVVEVVDDGAGGAAPAGGTGLRGMGDRVAALGGVVSVDSPVGTGTTVRIEVPCPAPS